MKAAFLSIALCGALTTFAQEQAPQEFRAGVDVVRLVVTVRDGHDRLITDLTRDDFEVVVARKPASLDVFTRISLPLSAVVLLQDAYVSGLERPREAARAIVDALGPRDRVMIATTGQEVGFSPFFSGDTSVLHRVLTEETRLPAGNSFNLGNALRAAVGRLEQAPAKRAVILVGWVGANPCGEWILFCTPPEQAGAAAQAKHVTIYGVSMYGVSIAGREEPGLSIARQSGGGMSRPQPNDNLAWLMADVLEQLRHEYVLGVVLPTRDANARNISIRVRRPGLTASVIRQEQTSR